MEMDCQAPAVSRFAPFASWFTGWVSSMSQSDIVFFLTSNSGRWVVIQQRYWQLCLLTDSCVCLPTTVAQKICLLTDNGGRTKCACLLTMVAKWAVLAYWQWWQNELCLLADNGGRTSCAFLLTKGGRISPSVVSTSDSNAGQPEFEALPDKYSTYVQAISWIYSVSFGITWDSTLLRRPVKSAEILSGRYRKIRICILKPNTSVRFQERHTDFQILHHPVL
jgi:hypothetical protein